MKAKEHRLVVKVRQYIGEALATASEVAVYHLCVFRVLGLVPALIKVGCVQREDDH